MNTDSLTAQETPAPTNAAVMLGAVVRSWDATHANVATRNLMRSVAAREALDADAEPCDAALCDLVSLILRTLKPATFLELCDIVDRGPSRVRKAVEAIQASGMDVRLSGMR